MKSKYTIEAPKERGQVMDAESLPDYTEREVHKLVEQVSVYVDEYSLEQFAEGDLFLMLTHALQSATKKSNSLEVHGICLILDKLISRNKEELADLMLKKIDVAPYTGQSYLFTWIDQIYSAVLAKDSASLINLNLVITHLIDLENSKLLAAILEEQSKGNNKGMNVLLPLVQALLNASKEYFNQPTSNLVAELLVSIIGKNPTLVRATFLQAIQHKAFSGQCMLTLFANVMNNSLENNPQLFNKMANQLIETINENPKAAVSAALSRTIQRGPDAGLNTVHILLKALIKATHLKENAVVVQKLLDTLSVVLESSPSLMNKMMIENITSGDSINQNGATMLTQALLASANNKYNITPMIKLFDKLIATEGASNVIEAIQQKVKYSTTTYFELLSHFAEKNASNPDVVPIKELLSELNSKKSPATTKPSESEDENFKPISALTAGKQSFFPPEEKQNNSESESAATSLSENYSKQLR
jgi:hypothetical protein